MTDSGLTGFDPTRVGIIFGSAVGGIATVAEQAHDPRASAGPTGSRRASCRTSSSTPPSGQLAISLGIKGPNYAIVSACATGSHAIGEAAELIKRGDADAVIAGGTEACVDPLLLAGFTAMRGLAAEDEQPADAPRGRSTRRATAS